MSPFPSFGRPHPAKAANPAKVSTVERIDRPHFSNFRSFSSPTPFEIEQSAGDSDLAQRVADLADAYAERIAIVLEAGDICESEARRIAEAEIGAAFVRAFLPGEAAP